jgi:hypothetical protein
MAQINDVKNAVLELCRGGTLDGNASNYIIEGTGEVKTVLIPKLLDSGAKGQATFSGDEWNGIKANIPKERNQAAWNECVNQNTKLFLDKLSENSMTRPLLGAPSETLLQTPALAEMTETVKILLGGSISIGLYSCSNQRISTEKTIITCYFVLTNGKKQRNFSSEDIAGLQPKLIDDSHREHILEQLYFLNGRGQKQSTVNLDQGDHVWFGTEFAGGADDINSERGDDT